MARYLTSDTLIATSCPVTALGISVGIWMRCDNLTENHFGIWLGNSSTGKSVRISEQGANTNDPSWAASYNGTTVDRASINSYPNNSWHHLGATFASTTSRIAYRGGSSGSNTTSNDPAASTWDRIAIGGDGAGTASGNVSVAEAAVWNAVLSAQDFLALEAGCSPLLVRPDALVFYAPLFGEGGDASNEIDIIGGLTLTQTGSPVVVDHPRIIYPRRRTIILPAAAAAATAKTATASLNTAIRVGNAATSSLSAAVQVAMSATASINAAIRAEQTATASLNAAVQAAITATASMSAALLHEKTATADVSAAVVEARSLTASLDAALLQAKTAGASLDAYIQSGSIVVASLDAAIQIARTASADLSAAIATSQTATASLAAAIAVRNTVTATIGAAIQQARAGTASLSAYIYDADAIVYGALNRRSQRADRAARRTPTGRTPQVDRRRRLH